MSKYIDSDQLLSEIIKSKKDGYLSKLAKDFLHKMVIDSTKYYSFNNYIYTSNALKLLSKHWHHIKVGSNKYECYGYYMQIIKSSFANTHQNSRKNTGRINKLKKLIREL
jgi:hypothetical protein